MRLRALALGIVLASPAAAQTPSPRDGWPDPAAVAALEPAIDAAFAEPDCADAAVQAPPLGFAEDIVEADERPVLRVTSLDDTHPHRARAEAGTLRWALGLARRGGARIVVDPRLKGGRIVLAAPLAVPSETSIDGGCTGLRLDAPDTIALMRLRDVHDVAIRRLVFAREVYDPASKSAGDAINLAGRFDRIVIEANRFRRCGDGCIDIVHVAPGGAGRVTIARNLFRDHNKVLLFANNPCLRPDPEPGCAAHAGEPAADLLRPRAHVSLVGNVFWDTSQRHPNVGAQIYVHALNNLVATRHAAYAEGRRSAIGGMAALNGGFLLAQANLFLRRDGAAPHPRALVTLDVEPDPHGRTRGFLRAERNAVAPDMRVEPHAPERVPDPRYRRPLREIAVEARDPRVAARCLIAALGATERCGG